MWRRVLLLACMVPICIWLSACHRSQPVPPVESPSLRMEELPPSVLIVVETEGPGGPAVAESAQALDTLIAHFDQRCAIASAAEYEAVQLAVYSHAFYFAGKPDAAARQSFAADLSAYEGTATWVGPGVESLGDPAIDALGLEPAPGQGGPAPAVPWTISYSGQRHAERVPIPSVAAREGAQVLSGAVRGTNRRPFIARSERLWYAAAGPVLKRERFWTGCIWADALHEILGEPHEGEPRRLVCVLRDVPIWTTRRQVPSVVRPVLAQGVPVAVMAATNWGAVPLSERPQAVRGLREAESLGAAIALVSSGGVDAVEHWRLAWEVGLHPVAWAGPANGGNPFRLRIAEPDDSPPYCAGGLLPAAIAISDAGHIAQADVDRMVMQEVVRDATALVSFGLWAPAAPFLEFVASRESDGWQTADLRDLGVRVSDSRRTLASGKATVRVEPKAVLRETIFGPKWDVLAQRALAVRTNAPEHEISAPPRSAAMVELLRETTARPFIKGVTVDPWAYSPSRHSGRELAETLADQLSLNGVNTVFFYAYNVDGGAAYRTRYRGASVSEWGRQDLLAHLLDACHDRDIRVVAWMYNGRDRGMWLRHPKWRERTKDGKAHNPLRLHAAYFLCTRNPEVRRWFAGLMRDLGRRYPTLDGIELCEPVVNWFGDQACYCHVCREEFANAHPGEPLGGAVWRQFRAEGMTEFLSECMKAIAEEGIESYVMTISDALDNGAILSPGRQAEESGFDLDALLDGPYPPDWVNFEIIWQQWAAIYGPEVFNTDWAAETAARLVRRTDGRAGVILHVELTDFGSQRMRPADIAETIERVREAEPNGIECYHTAAIDRKRAWPVLRRAYEGLP